MTQLVNILAEYSLYLGIPLALLAIVAWVYRPSAKKRYQADGNIPFDEDEEVDKTRQGSR